VFWKIALSGAGPAGVRKDRRGVLLRACPQPGGGDDPLLPVRARRAAEPCRGGAKNEIAPMPKCKLPISLCASRTYDDSPGVSFVLKI